MDDKKQLQDRTSKALNTRVQYSRIHQCDPGRAPQSQQCPHDACDGATNDTVSKEGIRVFLVLAPGSTSLVPWTQLGKGREGRREKLTGKLKKSHM